MCGNSSREETIQGWKLYEEIRYIFIPKKPKRWCEKIDPNLEKCLAKVTEQRLNPQGLDTRKFCEGIQKLQTSNYTEHD